MYSTFLKIVFYSIVFFSSTFLSANTYYVSSLEGDDSANGSITSPWKTLDKISSVVLNPGDQVCFKKGEVFNGHFVVNGSGTLGNEIVITSYGSGDKPIISGQVGAADGGDYQEAIYVLNNDNIIFENIEIRNNRLDNRVGVDDEIAYGLHIRNDGNRVLKNFTIRNVTVKSVYAPKPILDKEDFNGLEVAGIRFFSAWNTLNNQRNIQDIIVEDCYFEDLQRLGIHFKHGGAANTVTDDFINRIANVICRNNTFYYLGGTSILPQRTYNCLIENNIFDHPGATTDPRMPGRGSSVWTFHCINTVIQYNKCISTRGYLDSHGIHIDHSNVDTFIQYNYMEDCEGGFVEILKGNKNAVYRFNISVNDGWRNGGGVNGTWANSNHTLWIDNGDTGNSGTDVVINSEDNYIYNNTIILDYKNIDDTNKKETTAIEMRGLSMYVFNNIFYSIDGGGMGKQFVNIQTNGDEYFMQNNLFYGDVDTRFSNRDMNSVTSDPKFNEDSSGAYNYQLLPGSPAVNSGYAMTGPPIPGAGTGVFKDVSEYPTEDYFGNTIDLSSGTPNIGASNAKNGEIVLSLSDLKSKTKSRGYKIYPNPGNTTFYIECTHQEKKIDSIELIDVHGKTIQSFEDPFLCSEATYKLELMPSISNGIYFFNIISSDSTEYLKVIINN